MHEHLATYVIMCVYLSKHCLDETHRSLSLSAQLYCLQGSIELLACLVPSYACRVQSYFSDSFATLWSVKFSCLVDLASLAGYCEYSCVNLQ